MTPDLVAVDEFVTAPAPESGSSGGAQLLKIAGLDVFAETADRPN